MDKVILKTISKDLLELDEIPLIKGDKISLQEITEKLSKNLNIENLEISLSISFEYFSRKCWAKARKSAFLSLSGGTFISITFNR